MTTTTQMVFIPKHQRGSVSLTENTPLNTSKKTFYVTPEQFERKKKISEVKNTVFSELKYFNVILTNACNLSCSYCFEQHKKDYGRFTLDSLWTMYNFLLTANNDDSKLFQFFGGEPLAQKKLILDFCKTYQHELEKNKRSVRVSIVTNGLLLTPEFIEEYFSYDFTQIVISLDTDDASVDQRDVTQEGIDHIFEMIKLIPTEKKDDHQVCIRSTMNEESVHRFKGFVERLYSDGIRNVIIHPLIMSRSDGKLNWSEQAWNQIHMDILKLIDDNHNLKIIWAEGVGSKGNSNCLIGSDMIAVDSSGDFSGCYFFTNLKESFGSSMLGNILNDEIYVDRYVKFQQMYKQALIQHEECRTCDLQNYCYQCPAGNLATDGIPFRPDGMCKRIVRLFLDLRTDLTKKDFYEKLISIKQAYDEEGEIILSRAIIHLMVKRLTGKYLDIKLLKQFDNLPNYQIVLSFFQSMLVNNTELDYPETIEQLNTLLLSIGVVEEHQTKISALDFYIWFCKEYGYQLPKEYSSVVDKDGELYMVTMLHLLILTNSHFKRKQEDEHLADRVLSL